MSAYIVMPDVLNYAADAVRSHAQHLREFGKCGEERSELACKTAEEIAFELGQLNADAVNYRYRSDDSAMVNYRRQPKLSDMALLENLECLIYQCSEGNIVDRFLFKALDETANAIARRICRKERMRKSYGFGA